MLPIPFYLIIEIFALITSVIAYPKMKGYRLHWFSYFLFFIVTVELVGRYFSRVLHLSNVWLYNITVPIEYLFYCFIFSRYLTSKISRKIIPISVVSFLIATLLSYVQYGNNAIFHSETLFLGNFIVVLLSCMYFYELFLKLEHINLLQEPIFWIVSGLLLFNSGEILYSIVVPLLKSNGLVDKDSKIFLEINNQMIVVLYLSYSIAFLCTLSTFKYKKK